MKRSSVRVGCVLAVIAAGSIARAADWLPGYDGAGYRQMLSVTNAAHLTADLTNFPVLVRFTPDNFSYLQSTPDGCDVRFTADDGITPLAFEREVHDKTRGLWLYWVRLPVVHAGTNTEFYFYHSPWPTNDAANASNTWAGTGYVVVQHMEESGGALLDSTGNAYDQAINGDMVFGAAGLIDGAVGGAGAGSLTAPALQPPYNGTYSFWIKPTFGSGALVRYMQAGQGYSYAIELNGDNTVRTVTHDGNNIDILDTTATAPNGQWTHVVASFGSGQLIYMDGMLNASNGSGRGARFANENLTFAHAGLVDEFRVSSVRFSAEWIKTTCLSESDALLSHGPVEGDAPLALPGFSGRIPIAVTNYQHLSSNLVNVPVMVRLTAANFDFRLAREDGADIRFTWENGVTPLSFEREQHDAVSTQAVYWVRLPVLLQVTNTGFYLYYGNPGATDAASASNVWAASDYRMVQHAEETSGTTLYDSTANVRDLGLGSRTLGAAGQIGNGAGGTGAAGDRTDAAMLANTFTYSAWIKPSGYNTSLAYGDIPGVNVTYGVGLDTGGKVTLYHHTGAAHVNLAGTTTVPSNAWTHVVHVLGGGADSIYVNGDLDASGGGGSVWFNTGGQRMIPINSFNGVVDEVRLSNGVLSAQWIKTMYLSECDALLQFGEVFPRGFLFLVR